jgi:hypothetical protein
MLMYATSRTFLYPVTVQAKQEPSGSHKYIKRKTVEHNRYIPKSSKDIFSLGTPRLSSILITALFMTGGPQK